jgi:hypothetical protein
MLKEPLNHPVVWMEFGPVIALADVVALKMGALHDRALPRDVLDAHGASSHFTRAELIGACRAALDEDLSLSHPGVWSPRRENGRGAGRGGLGFAAARWPGLGDLAAERVRMVQVGCGLPVTPSIFGIRART